MAHIPIKKLEILLALADEDKNKQKEFYETLLTTYVYVAGTVDIKEGDPQGTVHLRYFQGEGRWILPFFTQLEFLQAVLPEDVPVITIRGKELFDSIDAEATAVLNIGTDLDKTFTPPEIADISSGRIFNYYQ
ncbi:SseB family protein [Bacillus sp. NPDC077411]|uniref:SseB family protein n=1 Tax=Bacillus bruguierae TaxID=3127667 RepID=A0ABU8FD68_9BACI